MNSPTFLEAISQGVLVFDGAMGTELYRHHVFTNRCFDELSLSDPKLIRTIHAEYCDAGADVLTTNTFGANRISLAHFGLAEKVREINRAAVAIAREIADQSDRPVFVAGSIGPPPAQTQFESQIESVLSEQVECLKEAGVDFILFETQPNRVTLEKCVAVMQRHADVPFVLSFTIECDGETATGESIESLMKPFAPKMPSPVAWGMNCGCGPDGLLSSVERAVRLTTLPLIVQPNAGMPKEVDHRQIYLCSPEYLTEYAKRFVGLGVSAIGGCCGTTPDHIRAIAATIKPLARMESKPVLLTPSEPIAAKPSIPFAEKSNLARCLAEKKWVASVELVPPRGYDLQSTIEKSRVLRDRGVTAINIPDGPRASSRISPLITAEHIFREAQIEPVLHFCCRDRNLIGMQADLLACAACGIRNILFVTGDPPKLGDYPHATGVFDADSIGMAAVQRRLNEGFDLGGQSIDPQTFAVIGVGLDPSALDRQRELDRFRRKVEAGAEFAITQPVFDPDALLRFLDEVDVHSLPIIAGIWPLVSYRNAAFMRNEVPGVVVPDSVMERMASVESRDDQMAMGIEIACESVARIRDRIAGIQVSAPFGRIETSLAVIDGSDSS